MPTTQSPVVASLGQGVENPGVRREQVALRDIGSDGIVSFPFEVLERGRAERISPR